MIRSFIALLFLTSTVFADIPKSDLIPLSTFFSDPQYAMARISPDGKHLAYLSPHQGVLNVWVGDANQPKSIHPITHNKERGISSYFWAYNNEHLIYMDDNQGNENWRIYRVDIKDGKKLELATFEKVQGRVIATSKNFPDEILVGLNKRRPDFHDVYRLNIRDGKMTLVYENNTFVDFTCDDNFNLRIAMETTPDGGAMIYTLDKDFTRSPLFKIEQPDLLTTSPISFNKSADTLYLLDSRGRNTGAFTTLNLQTKKTTLVAANEKADISNVLIHPTEKTIQGYASTYEKQQWTILDKSIQPDMDYLKQLAEGEFQIVNRSLDDKKWIVAYMRDNGSPRYYAYDRTTHKADFLFDSKPKLEGLPLTHMDPVIIQSRDKLPLVSYLSLPNAVRKGPAEAKTPVPLILYVHGGPNARDEWGYDSVHQWLSNRGYAVLSVNYRGSTGFGKAFINAGNGEWGQKMHDDLLDAVEWAIQQGITTRDKVAIMGGSYGGYATLVGLTRTPDVFACGIDIVGPSNLETLFKSIPDYWKPLYASMKIMIGGDPETEEGRKFLAAHSPLTFVNKIKKPLLIGQGANDPRVKQAESDQIVQKMQSNGIPVTYVLYPDEGHGFQRPENRLSFFKVAEVFLAQNLGGKREESQNHKEGFKNSSIEIKVGKEYIPGL
jgi:dipeptidyl aminopeptidase/acylaminoacyl peptidase